MVNMQVPATPAVDSQTNTTATATLAAPGSGFKWRVVAVSAAYTGANVASPGFRAVLTIGATTIGRGVQSGDAWQQSFPNGMDGADNGAVTLALPAGGVGAVGDVMIAAIKVPTSAQ